MPLLREKVNRQPIKRQKTRGRKTGREASPFKEVSNLCLGYRLSYERRICYAHAQDFAQIPPPPPQELARWNRAKYISNNRYLALTNQKERNKMAKLFDSTPMKSLNFNISD
jgi:hypothetical protein